MITSKDNPHKPGTDEWKAFERTIMDRQRFAVGKEYQDAKDVADKRLKTATEQIRLQEEKSVWVDEILEFLDGDEPEYDEILDGPIVDEVDDNDYWKSLNAGADPLNWNQIVAAHYQQHANWYSQPMSYNQAVAQYGAMTPVFKGNIVVPKYVPGDVSIDSIFDKVHSLQNEELSEETYARGWLAVPIRPQLGPLGLTAMIDPSTVTYTVAEFYVRRK